MTATIFREWLEKVNQIFVWQKRRIILFIDNCTTHPEVYFSNIQLVYLPPNTTSWLQPMDAGIIQAVKMTYRKKLAKHLLFKVDQCNSASDLAMQVNVLDAILRLKANWDSVSTSTITKCFVNCGFSGGDISGSEEERVDEDIP